MSFLLYYESYTCFYLCVLRYEEQRKNFMIKIWLPEASCCEANLGIFGYFNDMLRTMFESWGLH